MTPICSNCGGEIHLGVEDVFGADSATWLHDSPQFPARPSLCPPRFATPLVGEGA